MILRILPIAKPSHRAMTGIGECDRNRPLVQIQVSARIYLLGIHGKLRNELCVKAAFCAFKSRFLAIKVLPPKLIYG
jgi:hypothetical protein